MTEVTAAPAAPAATASASALVSTVTTASLTATVALFLAPVITGYAASKGFPLTDAQAATAAMAISVGFGSFAHKVVGATHAVVDALSNRLSQWTKKLGGLS